MATMNISLPDPMKNWIATQIDSGKYASSSDYVRDLIRRDQEKATEVQAIRAALIEGEKSGLSERTIDEIMNTVIERKRSNGTL